MTVARAELFDGYRLRRVGIRIEEQGVVRARRLLLIWLFQQARAPLCLLHSESPRHGALLKQPDKQKAARLAAELLLESSQLIFHCASQFRVHLDVFRFLPA